MSLCKTCQSLPFHSIPRLPTAFDAYSMPDPGSTLYSIVNRSGLGPCNAPRPPDPPRDQELALGVEYHADLEGLRKAVDEGCVVCRIVKGAVGVFRGEWDGDGKEGGEDRKDEKDGDGDGKEGVSKEKKKEQALKKRGRSKGPDWEMRIVKGVRHDFSGFLVVSRDQERRRCAWVLASLGVCVDDDDPLREFVRGRKIHEDPTSDISIGRARKWLQQCEEEHKDGRCAAKETKLPARLLDVEKSNSREVGIEETAGRTGRYAALSYISDSEPTYPTKESLQDFEQGLEWQNWPKTIKDAVVMTRKLGLKYLWVDVFCICKEELPQMIRENEQYAEVFSNAYVVLSALCAPDSNEGFLQPRTPPTYTSFPYTHSNKSGTLHISTIPKQPAVFPIKTVAIQDEPLSQQAWSLQERFLAPRILHFGSSQMFFECYGNFLSEDGLHLNGRLESLYPDTNPRLDEENLSLDVRQSLVWQSIISSYCRRQLPRSSDKLPAIANLVRAVARQTGHTYVAGLWRESLVEELTWQSVGFVAGKTKEPEQWRAPSWSWTSIDGPFGLLGKRSGFDEGEWVDLATVQECEIVLKDEANPFGEVSAGHVVLRAPMEALFACEDDNSLPEKYKKQSWRLRTEKGKERGGFCIFDTPSRAEMAKKSKVEALLLAKVKGKGCPSWDYQAIAVAKKEGSESYQRLGKMIFGEEDLGDCAWKNDESEYRVVTLV